MHYGKEIFKAQNISRKIFLRILSRNYYEQSSVEFLWKTLLISTIKNDLLFFWTHCMPCFTSQCWCYQDFTVNSVIRNYFFPKPSDEGLSKYGGITDSLKPKLEKCLQDATNKLPTGISPQTVPLFMKATAGMRKLR